MLGIQNSLGEKRIALIATEDGTVLRTFADEFATSLESAHFLAADQVLSLTSDNRLVIWSTEDGGLIRQLGFSPQPLAKIDVDAQGTVALGQGVNGSAYIWRISPSQSERIRLLDERADAVAINQAGDALLITDSGGTRLMRIADEEILFQSRGGSLARMNADGTQFAVAAAREIQLIDAGNGQIEATWTWELDQAVALHLAPVRTDALLAQSQAGELLLLRADQPAPQRLNIRLNNEDFGEPRLVRFSADSSAVLSLHPGGALYWQGDNREPTAAYSLGLAPDYAGSDRFKVALSEDGGRLFFFVQLEAGLAGLTVVDREADTIQRHTFVDVAFGELAASGKYLLLSRGRWQPSSD